MDWWTDGRWGTFKRRAILWSVREDDSSVGGGEREDAIGVEERMDEHIGGERKWTRSRGRIKEEGGKERKRDKREQEAI